MPRFVSALFDDPDAMSDAIDALHDRGIELPDIQTIDKKRQNEGFFDRLFLDENGQPPGDDVTVMGIARSDVDDVARRIRQGQQLLIAMCDEQLEDQARDIVSRFGGVDLSGPHWQTPPVDEADTAAKRPPPEATPKWFDVVEVDEISAEDIDRDVRQHAVHIHTRPDIHHVASDELPGARPSPRFDQLETDFRVHYAENFADNKYSFDDYRLAYVYGMDLARNDRLRKRGWTDIKAAARRGWRDHTSNPWSAFEEAVHFGWRKVLAYLRRRAGRRG